MRPVTSSRHWPSFSRCAAIIISITTTPFGPGASQRMARYPMPTREFHIAVLAVFALASATRAQEQSPYGIGRSATPTEIAGWNIDIDRDGNNLRPGSGTARRGRGVFKQQCSACHGAKGEGGLGDKLVGGDVSLRRPKPNAKAGTCWPYASTLFDYIR